VSKVAYRSGRHDKRNRPRVAVKPGSSRRRTRQPLGHCDLRQRNLVDALFMKKADGPLITTTAFLFEMDQLVVVPVPRHLHLYGPTYHVYRPSSAVASLFGDESCDFLDRLVAG